MGPNPVRKARIVARIRGQSKKEAESFDGVSIFKQPWVSVQRPGEKSNSNLVGRVKISFESEKTSRYSVKSVDFCFSKWYFCSIDQIYYILISVLNRRFLSIGND